MPFSLNQAHVEEGGTAVWDDPEREADLLAGQVGIVVRDRSPSSSSARTWPCSPSATTEAADLRDQATLAARCSRATASIPARVFEEIKSGWPLDEFRKAHEALGRPITPPSACRLSSRTGRRPSSGS